MDSAKTRRGPTDATGSASPRRLGFGLLLAVVGYSLALALAVLSWADPRWLEAFGADPDRGSGAVELLVVAGAVGLGTVGTALRLRRDRGAQP